MAALPVIEVTETQKEIGRGAYATVVEVEYCGLKAAAKKLHPILTEENPEERNTILPRFEEECRLLSQLHHPNIVQFLGIYYEDIPHSQLPVLVMEFLPTTLAAYLQREGIAPSTSICYNILHGVVLGLRYLHERPSPIIHRDLTANNVLLSHNLTTAKISDLGVARVINLTPLQIMSRTRAPGTTCYMPPEALVADPVYTTEIDIFSFGILMLHLFSAQWPVPTDPPVIVEQLELLPLTEADRRQKYLDCLGRGNALRELIHRCIRNNPEARPRASDVHRRIADAIAGWQDGRKPMTPDPYHTEELRSKSSRHELALGELKMQLEEAKLELKEAHVTLIDQQVEAHARRERLTADYFAKLEKQTEELKACKTTYEREITTLKEQLLLVDSATKATAASMEALIATKDDKIKKISEMIQNQRERLRNALEDENTLHPFSPQAVLSWKDCAPLPAPMLGAQAVAVGTGKVYVGSGEANTTEFDYTVFEYNFIENKWKCLPSCPVRLFGLGHLQGDVVVVGGVTRNDTISGAVYTLDKDGWTPTVIPAMTIPRHSPTIVNYNSTLIAIGGSRSPTEANSLLDSIEVYKNGDWYCALESLPEPRSAMSHVIINDMCYLLGGYHKFQGESSKAVLCGNLPALVEHARSRSRTPSVCSRTSACSTCSCPSITAPGSTWSKIEGTPLSLSTPVAIGGCLLAIGGYSNRGLIKVNKIHDDIYVYCPTNDTWVQIASLPLPRALATAVSLPTGEVIVIGGRDNKLERSNNVAHGILTLKTGHCLST